MAFARRPKPGKQGTSLSVTPLAQPPPLVLCKYGPDASFIGGLGREIQISTYRTFTGRLSRHVSASGIPGYARPVQALRRESSKFSKCRYTYASGYAWLHSPEFPNPTDVQSSQPSQTVQEIVKRSFARRPKPGRPIWPEA